MNTVLAQPADEGTIEKARADIKKLELAVGELPAEKICAMLVGRYPRAVLAALYPGQCIPERSLGAQQQRRRASDTAIQTRTEPSTTKQTELATVASVLSNSLQQARDSRPASVGELAYQYVPLIQCTFPHSEQGSVSTYTRRNGHLELTIATSVAGVGLPYGVPVRLLTIFTATEVVRTKSRQIFLGPTITDFLRRIHVTPTSGRRGSIPAYHDQLKRLINAVFTVQEHIVDGEREGLGIEKALFADKALLWNDAGKKEGSWFLLSEPIYESMRERSAPLSLDAVRVLRKSPMDLDVYAWLVYRLFQLRRPLLLPWSDLGLQFGQSYSRESDFRTYFEASLKRVKKVYPDARVATEPAGLRLLPSRAHISRAGGNTPWF